MLRELRDRTGRAFAARKQTREDVKWDEYKSNLMTFKKIKEKKVNLYIGRNHGLKNGPMEALFSVLDLPHLRISIVMWHIKAPCG